MDSDGVQIANLEADEFEPNGELAPGGTFAWLPRPVKIGLAVLSTLLFTALCFGRDYDFGAPMALSSHVYMLLGEEITAVDFVALAYDDSIPAFLRGNKSPEERSLLPAVVVPYEGLPSDAGEAECVLSARFVVPPDCGRLGVQDVTIQLKDSAGNKTNVPALLTVMRGTRGSAVEAGIGAAEIVPSLFIWDENAANASFITDVGALDLHTHGGQFALQLLIDGFTMDFTLFVQDTVAPRASIRELTFWTVDRIEAIDFVTDIVDANEVAVSFAEEYDFSAPGSYDIGIVLRDSAGNSSTLSTRAHVMLDEEAPVITGVVANRTYLLDSGISYRNGVTVTDNRDTAIVLRVDASQVDASSPGDYPVTYSATDLSGNTTSVTVTIRILNADENTVYAKADEILGRILKADMTQREKARAIFIWVRKHLVYVKGADKTGVLQSACAAFFTGRGDCYTYYAASEVLLTRAGIETVGVERVPEGRTRHYWNLVCIDGLWYHFDTCPPPVALNTFLFTEGQAEQYTRIIGVKKNNVYTHYYDYVKDNCPEVVR